MSRPLFRLLKYKNLVNSVVFLSCCGLIFFVPCLATNYSLRLGRSIWLFKHHGHPNLSIISNIIERMGIVHENGKKGGEEIRGGGVGGWGVGGNLIIIEEDI